MRGELFPPPAFPGARGTPPAGFRGSAPVPFRGAGRAPLLLPVSFLSGLFWFSLLFGVFDKDIAEFAGGEAEGMAVVFEEAYGAFREGCGEAEWEDGVF